MLRNMGSYTTLVGSFCYTIGGDEFDTNAKIVEVPYDGNLRTGVEPLSIAYGNLRDEKNSGEFGPYLKDKDDIDETYNEPAPDPNGTGFVSNWRQQLLRRKAQGFQVIEPDNQDTYNKEEVLYAFRLAQRENLFVVAKNPNAFDNDDDAADIISHSAVCGIIVEKADGPTSDLVERIDRLRRLARKPNLWVQFVAFDEGKRWAQDVAGIARLYPNMGVSYYAGEGEYTMPREELWQHNFT